MLASQRPFLSSSNTENQRESHPNQPSRLSNERNQNSHRTTRRSTPVWGTELVDGENPDHHTTSASHEPRRNKWLEVYFHLCFFAAVASYLFRNGPLTRLISFQVSKNKDGLKTWFWQALVAQLLTFRQDLWRRCLRASAGAAVHKRAGLGLLGGFGGFHVSCQASLTWRLTSFLMYFAAKKYRRSDTTDSFWRRKIPI